MTRTHDMNADAEKNPATWQMLSRRFVWASRAFLLVILAGFVYSLHHAMALAPAIRDAQFDTQAVRRAAGIEAYRQKIGEVVADWDRYTARYPVDTATWIGLIVAFGFVAAAFAWIRRPPRSESIDIDRLPAELRSRFEMARAAFGESIVFRRCAVGSSSYRIANTFYLAPDLYQRLSLRDAPHAVDDLLFVMRHETVHGEAFDNAFAVIGRSILLLVSASTILYTANYLLVSIVIEFPTDWMNWLGDGPTYTLVALLAFGLFALTYASMTGFSAAYYGVREFFADIIPACRSPEHRHPYDPTVAEGDERHRGTWFSAWALPPPLLDRLEHVVGRLPRRGALVASAAALWVAERTLILTTTFDRGVGAVLVFDLAVLATIVSMARALPGRVRGHIDYGFVPWTTTIVIAMMLVSGGWFIDEFAIGVLKVPGFAASWLATLTLPPLIALPPLAVWTLRARSEASAVDQSSNAAPRPVKKRRLALAGLALPARAASLFLAVLPLYIFSVVVAEWTRENLAGSTATTTTVWDFAVYVPMLGIILLILKNHESVSRRSGWLEAIVTIVGISGSLVGLVLLMFAWQDPRANGVQPSPELLGEVLSTNAVPFALVLIAVVLVAAILLVPSWWARLRIDVPPRD